MIDNLFMVSGVFGAFLAVLMYFLLQTRRLTSESMVFYGVNALSSLLILISVCYMYDNGDAGSILMEISWLLISLMGVRSAIVARKLSKSKSE